MNNKINWRQKLSSRKFWAMLAGVIISVLAAAGAPPETTQSVTGLIGAVGTIAVYMLAQGIADAGRGE